jgi:hypothetical protein
LTKSTTTQYLINGRLCQLSKTGSSPIECPRFGLDGAVHLDLRSCSARRLNRVQIDLMDFKVLADGEYKYILQIKDTFSRHIWLYPLKNRFAEDVYEVLIIWLGQNGYPSKFGADNGGEFKGMAFPTPFSNSNY